MYPHPKAWTLYNGTVLSLLSVWGGFKELENEPELSGCEPGSIVELKKERGWLKETNKEICLVDTVVSRLKKKMPKKGVKMQKKGQNVQKKKE